MNHSYLGRDEWRGGWKGGQGRGGKGTPNNNGHALNTVWKHLPNVPVSPVLPARHELGTEKMWYNFSEQISKSCCIVRKTIDEQNEFWETVIRVYILSFVSVGSMTCSLSKKHKRQTWLSNCCQVDSRTNPTIWQMEVCYQKENRHRRRLF